MEDNHLLEVVELWTDLLVATLLDHVSDLLANMVHLNVVYDALNSLEGLVVSILVFVDALVYLAFSLYSEWDAVATEDLDLSLARRVVYHFVKLVAFKSLWVYLTQVDFVKLETVS